jgi:hypothetical protein
VGSSAGGDDDGDDDGGAILCGTAAYEYDRLHDSLDGSGSSVFGGGR